MASKTKYNIVVGAKLDPTNNISAQIQSAISKTTYKINIDVAYLTEQINKALSASSFDIGKITSRGGGSSGSGGSGGSGSKLSSPVINKSVEDAENLIQKNHVVAETYNQVSNSITKTVSGLNELGAKYKVTTKMGADGVEKLVSVQVKEGDLVNENAQTYERLSARLKTLSQNGQITKKSSQQLTKSLEEANKMTDEFGKKARFKEIGQEMSDASKHAMTFGQMLKTAYEKFAIWSIATVSWYALVRAMKDVVKQTIEIDKAFTRLQMITLASREEIDKMKSSYIALAKEMKVSLGTVTDAAETWLRTGMNAAEANTALQASTVLSKDAFMEGADAASVLIAAQKAYKLETNDLIGVVDKLTTLDTKAATTAQDLGEALALSGASASAAGFSMDKYLALLATSSEVTQQSASVIGNAWKTLTARLRKVGAGESLDDDGEDISDVDKVLKQYGINLREVSNGMTNMENVVTALGEKWKYLNGEQKAQIATAVAGTRQQNIFIATMENYDRVLELTAESTNSAGSAMDKFNVYAESTEGKLQDLKTAWTELADATLNSDILEWFIEIGTQFLETTTKAGGLIPVIIELAGAFLMLKNIGTGNVLGLVLGGAAITGAGIYQIVETIKSKKEDDYSKLIEESNLVEESIEKEQSETQSLMGKYLELNSILEKTETQKKELANVSKELAKALDLENDAIEDNILSYETAIKGYATNIVSKLEKGVKDQQAILDATLETAKSDAEANAKAFEVINTLSLGIIGAIAGITSGGEWQIPKPSDYLDDEAVKNAQNALSALETELDVARELSENLLTEGLGLDKWERSSKGVLALEQKLERLNIVMDELREKSEADDTEAIDSLLAYYNVVLDFYKTEIKTFKSTDFVLTEYYDKRLQALKEQKELEDELAKQKENEEKRANAELKVQEATLDVEKKRAALAEAKEKRIQVFRMGKGLVYEEDTESIANAQADLNKSLENYTSAQKDLAKTIADIEGTLTEQLISAVQQLEKVYGYALANNPKIREFFLDEENRTKYESWSQADQLAFLMQFLTVDQAKTVQAEIAAMGQTAVENFGLTSVIADREKAINLRGEEIRAGAFGDITGEGASVGNYFAKTDAEIVQEVIDKYKLREGDRNRWGQAFKHAGVLDAYSRLSADERKALKGYHTGGIVGQPAFSSDNEMYAKLLKGEIVLPQTKFNDIINKVQGVTNNDSTVISIGNISLPSVTDTDSFVNELKRISYSS